MVWIEFDRTSSNKIEFEMGSSEELWKGTVTIEFGMHSMSLFGYIQVRTSSYGLGRAWSFFLGGNRFFVSKIELCAPAIRLPSTLIYINLLNLSNSKIYVICKFKRNSNRSSNQRFIHKTIQSNSIKQLIKMFQRYKFLHSETISPLCWAEKRVTKM